MKTYTATQARADMKSPADMNKVDEVLGEIQKQIRENSHVGNRIFALYTRGTNLYTFGYAKKHWISGKTSKEEVPLRIQECEAIRDGLIELGYDIDLEFQPELSFYETRLKVSWDD